MSPENATYFRTPLPEVPVGITSIENNGYSYRWRIPALTGLQREIIKPLPMYSFDASPTDRDPFDKRLYPHQFFAEVATSSFERDLHKENNTDRIWFDVTSQSGRSLQTKGRYSIKSVSVDEANPSPGDLVNFSIAARMPVNIDIQIAVELTDGLTVDVDSTAEPPREISYTHSASTGPQPTYKEGVITIGTRNYDDRMIELQYATIPVRVASTAVVNQQCLTATISGTPPPGAGPFNDDVKDNEQTLCLREPVEPFSTGQVDAFTIYPCVGISDPPCDNTDDIKVRAATTSHSTPLSSNSAVFRIDPLTSRTYDGHTNPSNLLQSVNDGNIVSWQPAVDPSSNYTGGVDSGVELYYSRTPYIGTTGWAGLTFGIAARDEHGNTPPPGKVFVRSAGSGNEIR